MGAGREGKEINERDKSYEQPQRESRVPVVCETLVMIVLRLKNPMPKRVCREHRGTHSKHDKRRQGTERDIETERRHSTHILCGAAGGKVFGVGKERSTGKKGGMIGYQGLVAGRGE